MTTEQQHAAGSRVLEYEGEARFGFGDTLLYLEGTGLLDRQIRPAITERFGLTSSFDLLGQPLRLRITVDLLPVGGEEQSSETREEDQP